MGGLFFLGLYLFGNRDKAYLLFSLYSIVYCYRMIGTDNYVLHSTLLPNISWYITVRLEYISLFAGIGLFGLYTRYLYPIDVQKVIYQHYLAIVCFSFRRHTSGIAANIILPILLTPFYSSCFVPGVYTVCICKSFP
jgi:hypothetical protein